MVPANVLQTEAKVLEVALPPPGAPMSGQVQLQLPRLDGREVWLPLDSLPDSVLPLHVGDLLTVTLRPVNDLVIQWLGFERAPDCQPRPPAYQVMREVVRAKPEDEFMPALLWLYGERESTIHLMALPGFEHEAEERRERVAYAWGRGFHPDEIWAYQAKKGGDGYFCLRTIPEPVEAGTIEEALESAYATLAAFGEQAKAPGANLALDLDI